MGILDGDNLTDMSSAATLANAGHNARHTEANTAIENIRDAMTAIIVHGATAGTSRHAGVTRVLWEGSVAPTNATSGDYWWDTTNELIKRYDGSAWNASGNGTYLQGEVVRKTADETVNNSTTLQDDDDLTFAIAANEIVAVTAVIYYTTSTAADLKVSMSGPSGSAGTIGMDALKVSAAGTDDAARRATFVVGGSNNFGGAGAKVAGLLHGLVVNGATAGSITFRWAQATAEASDTIVHAHSHLIVRRGIS